MTENKRYNIKPSKIIEDGFCIQDDEKEYSFPTIDDKSHLIMYEKALNEQDERIRELLQDNDHKFWKLQFMHQFNSTSLIMHEISLAIKEGYKVSDKFKAYLDELKTQNEEGMKKANEQEKW